MYKFDLKNCVSHDGLVYAWDARTKAVVIIEMNSVPIKSVPEEVIKVMLTENGRSEK